MILPKVSLPSRDRKFETFKVKNTYWSIVEGLWGDYDVLKSSPIMDAYHFEMWEKTILKAFANRNR